MCYHCATMAFLSLVVHGDIVLSINTQYNVAGETRTDQCDIGISSELFLRRRVNHQ